MNVFISALVASVMCKNGQLVMRKQPPPRAVDMKTHHSGPMTTSSQLANK